MTADPFREGAPDERSRGSASAPLLRTAPRVWPPALAAVTAYLSIGPALDDAYIVYRYVERFLDGAGLTFNDGEFVEGYTSLVWPLLLALGTALTRLEPHVASVVLNYLCLVGTVLVLPGLLGRLGVPAGWRVAGPSLVAVSFLHQRVAYLGLEFGLYSLLTVLFFRTLLPALQPDRPGGTGALTLAGLLGGALFGTRPESVMLFPLVLGALLVFGRDGPGARRLAWLAVPWLLVIAGIVAWRLAYYGEWLPNSVTAKSPVLRSMDDVYLQSRRGWDYLSGAYRQNPGLALAVAVVAARFCLAPVRQLQSFLLLTPAMVGHAAVLQNGGDWMPYFRFVNAHAPLYIAALLASLVSGRGRPGRGASLALAVFAAVYVPFNVRHFEPAITPVISRFDGWMNLYREAGEALRTVWIDGDVLVAESIGMLGYAAPDIYVHDPLGLTDRTLAHDAHAERTLYGRKNWRYSLGLEPAVVLLHHWPHQQRWRAFAEGYPENYSFWQLPWHGKGPSRCVYAIIRNDRAQRYGSALASLGSGPLGWAEVSYPCREGRAPAPAS